LHSDLSRRRTTAPIYPIEAIWKGNPEVIRHLMKQGPIRHRLLLHRRPITLTRMHTTPTTILMDIMDITRITQSSDLGMATDMGGDRGSTGVTEDASRI